MKIRTLLPSLLLSLLLVSMVGCNSAQTVNTTPLVSIGADAGTIALLNGIKNPADRQQAAQIAYDAAAAVYAATGTPPDYTAAKALITKEISLWKSPYAPLVQAVVLQALQQVQVNVRANPQAQAAINAAMLGVELGAVQFGAIPPAPPTTAPATTEAVPLPTP